MDFRIWFLRILTSRFAGRRYGPGALTPSGEPAAAPGDPVDAWPPAAGPPAADLFRNLDEQQIADAFARLPEADRTVCALYFTGEFRYAEIAQVVGHPTETVRARLHQGRKRLQQLLRGPVDPGRGGASTGLPVGAGAWSRPEAALGTC